MAIRVTPLMSLSQAISSARQHSSRLSDLQLQASTGIRLHRPSDDPQAIRDLLARKLDESRIDVQLENINDARLTLNESVSTLLDVNKLLVRARNIALDGNQSQTTDLLADEVDVLLNRLVDLANTETNGSYLFSGASLQQKPFQVQGSGVSYRGAAEQTSVVVAPEIGVDTRLSGGDVFQPKDRDKSLIVGRTGATSGTSVDSAVGRGTLTVRHILTTYAGASGIQPGSSSVHGDTIIGAAGSLTLTINDTSGTGAAGTISLDGGLAVAFTNTDTDLRLTGSNGEVVFVDTTSIAAGFSGSVSITADGTLSTDGGITEVPIDFSTNQAVINSETQKVTYINSVAIQGTGSDSIEYLATSDAFQALAELRDDLRNTRNLNQSQFHEAIERRIGEIDRIHNHVLSVVGQQSITLEDLQVIERRLEDTQLSTREAISALESADIAEVAIRLQSEQNLLQFTFATTARLFDQSLLNFLR